MVLARKSQNTGAAATSRRSQRSIACQIKGRFQWLLRLSSSRSSSLANLRYMFAGGLRHATAYCSNIPLREFESLPFGNQSCLWIGSGPPLQPSVVSPIPRVTQYWDHDHVFAKQIASDASQGQPNCCKAHNVLFDLISVYPVGAKWSNRLPPANVFDGPIFRIVPDIQPLLSGN